MKKQIWITAALCMLLLTGCGQETAQDSLSSAGHSVSPVTVTAAIRADTEQVSEDHGSQTDTAAAVPEETEEKSAEAEPVSIETSAGEKEQKASAMQSQPEKAREEKPASSTAVIEEEEPAKDTTTQPMVESLNQPEPKAESKEEGKTETLTEIPQEPLPQPKTEESEVLVPVPEEPIACTHDWEVIHHEAECHWVSGIVCDCGWKATGSGNLVSQLENHVAGFSADEAFFEHGGYASTDECVVDSPAYDEWTCRLCGEKK